VGGDAAFSRTHAVRGGMRRCALCDSHVARAPSQPRDAREAMDEPPKLEAEDTVDAFYDIPRCAARAVLALPARGC